METEKVKEGTIFYHGQKLLIDEERGTPKIYVEGNIGPRRGGPDVDEWAVVKRGWGPDLRAAEVYRSPVAFAAPPVTASDAADAREQVWAGAGAVRPIRDAADERIVAEVRTRTGRIIDTPAEAGGYPRLAPGTAPVDSDHDGMPDTWEREHLLDASDPSDANQRRDDRGYTNIEQYLHSLL